ncbi:MAG: hypothetical protein M1820_000662 [Bogoriella megaspora]|nr:MAG: hypothetical protein M1820_000662 [Bogoriella megaspora]
MSRVLNRRMSSLRGNAASEAAAEILQRFSNKPISIRKQFLDANQQQLLSLTLGRTSLHNGVSIAESPPAIGTPVPPGYHLVYFLPTILEKDLGADGTDRTVNPLSPFTRRMWAGGELEWSQEPEKLLRVGQTVEEATNVLSAEPKKLKSGGEMIVVGVEKRFENENGIALIDRRSWVYQPEITDKRLPPAIPAEAPFPEGRYVRDYIQTAVTLFRFSALTFNGHKIHYSPEWCRTVEGHRTCVVHGPLSLINILDLWRDNVASANAETVPKSISYRAMSPIYMDEKYRIVLENEGESDTTSKAEIWDSYGKIGMKGTITA